MVTHTHTHTQKKQKKNIPFPTTYNLVLVIFIKGLESQVIFFFFFLIFGSTFLCIYEINMKTIIFDILSLLTIIIQLK